MKIAARSSTGSARSGSFPIAGRWSLTGGVVTTITGPRTSDGLLVDPDHTFAGDHDDGIQIVGAIGVARSM